MARTKQTCRKPFSYDDGVSDREHSDDTYSDDDDRERRIETYAMTEPLRHMLRHEQERQWDLLDKVKESNDNITKITIKLRALKKKRRLERLEILERLRLNGEL